MSSMKILYLIFGLASVSLLFGLTSGTTEAHHVAEADLEFVNNSTCKLCHNDPAKGEQFTKWKASVHAHAYTTLLGEESDRIAGEMGLSTKAAESPECLRCHVTAYDADTRAVPAQMMIREGVQCDSCHGKGSAHLADGKELRMDPSAAIDVKNHRTAPHEAVCVQCHNPESPTWNPERYALDSGGTAGFEFIQARRKVVHPRPERAHLFFE